MGIEALWIFILFILGFGFFKGGIKQLVFLFEMKNSFLPILCFLDFFILLFFFLSTRLFFVILSPYFLIPIRILIFSNYLYR